MEEIIELTSNAISVLYLLISNLKLKERKNPIEL